jgi:hypothetical protein
VQVAEPALDSSVVLCIGADRRAAIVRQVGSMTMTLQVDDRLALTRSTVVHVEWSAEEGLARAACEVVTTRRGRAVVSRIGPMQLIQRRESVRVPLRLQVDVKHARGAAFGSTVDLSDGGMLVHVPRLRAEVGDRVELELDLPDRTVELLAEVVRAEGDDVFALMFTKVSAGARQRIVRLVAERRQQLEEAEGTAEDGELGGQRKPSSDATPATPVVSRIS